MDEWRGGVHGDPVPPPWSVGRLDEVMRAATAPAASPARLLWCAAVLSRGAASASAAEMAALRRAPGLLGALRHICTTAQAIAEAPVAPASAPVAPASAPVAPAVGARLLQHALAVHACLIGGAGDEWCDEAAVMDLEALGGWAAGLRARAHPELRLAAVRLARRVSELPHVSPVLVFSDAVFDALLDALEARDAPVVATHALHCFVNLCGHPKLHFKLARSWRVVGFAIDTLIRVLAIKAVRVASRRARSALQSTDKKIKSLPQWLCRALEVMAPTVPCAMLLANLLSFPENRAAMLSQHPDLPRALEQCDAQVVSMRLWEVARRAAGYLREDDAAVEAELFGHLGCSQPVGSHIPEEVEICE